MIGYLLIIGAGIYLFGVEFLKRDIYSKDFIELNEIEPEKDISKQIGVKDIVKGVVVSTVKEKVIGTTVKVIQQPIKAVSQIKSVTSKTIQTTEKVLKLINSNISGIASNVLLPLGLTYGIYKLGVNLEPRYNIVYIKKQEELKRIREELINFGYAFEAETLPDEDLEIFYNEIIETRDY